MRIVRQGRQRQPVANLRAVAIKRQWLAFEAVEDHKGNQILQELIRSAIPLQFVVSVGLRMVNFPVGPRDP